MKRNYEFTKELLSIMEDDEKNAVFTSQDLINKLEEKGLIKEKFIAKLHFHLQLLSDSECLRVIRYNNFHRIASSSIIENNLGLLISSDGKDFEITPEQFMLTTKGCDLSASLENDTIMNKVKEVGGRITIESLIGAGTAIATTILTGLTT